ncbi:mycothiol transferase [Streptomyces mayteni]
MAGAELGWFWLTFGHAGVPLPFEVEGGEASDWHVATDESAKYILDIDATGTAFAFFDGATVSLRDALIHMLEEVARHAGHADIMRGPSTVSPEITTGSGIPDAVWVYEKPCEAVRPISHPLAPIHASREPRERGAGR